MYSSSTSCRGTPGDVGRRATGIPGGSRPAPSAQRRLGGLGLLYLCMNHSEMYTQTHTCKHKSRKGKNIIYKSNTALIMPEEGKHTAVCVYSGSSFHIEMYSTVTHMWLNHKFLPSAVDAALCVMCKAKMGMKRWVLMDYQGCGVKEPRGVYYILKQKDPDAVRRVYCFSLLKCLCQYFKHLKLCLLLCEKPVIRRGCQSFGSGSRVTCVYLFFLNWMCMCLFTLDAFQSSACFHLQIFKDPN